MHRCHEEEYELLDRSDHYTLGQVLQAASIIQEIDSKTGKSTRFTDLGLSERELESYKVSYLPCLEYTPSYIFVVIPNDQVLIFQQKTPLFIHDSVFVTNLGIYRLEPVDSPVQTNVTDIFSTKYVNRQYGYVSRQVINEGEFKELINVRLPIPLKECTYQSRVSEPVVRLHRMSAEQYNRVRSEYWYVNYNIPKPVQDPTVDLSVRISTRECINPDIDLDRDLSLCFERKQRVSVGSRMHEYGIEPVYAKPDPKNCMEFRSLIPATSANPVFPKEFINSLVILEAMAKGKVIDTDDRELVELIILFGNAKELGWINKTASSVKRLRQEFHTAYGIPDVIAHPTGNQVVAYVKRQYGIDVDVGLICKQQGDVLINGKLENQIDRLTEKLVKQAFAGTVRVYDSTGPDSPIPNIEANIDNPTLQYITSQLTPVEQYPVSLSSSDKWIREAGAKLCPQGALVQIPGLDDMIIPLDSDERQVILERFAYTLATTISRRHLFYQFAFGGGISCDLNAVRTRVFRFVQEIIRSIQPDTQILAENSILRLQGMFEHAPSINAVKDLFQQVKQAVEQEESELLLCHRVIHSGMYYEKKNVSESAQSQLVSFLHVLVQHLNPFSNTATCDPATYAFNPSRFWQVELNSLLLNLENGGSVSIFDVSNQQSLSDIVYRTDRTLLDYLKQNSKFVNGLYMLQEYRHVYEQRITQAIYNSAIVELFRFHPQMPENYLLIASVLQILIAQIPETSCQDINTINTLIPAGSLMLQLDPVKDAGNTLECRNYERFLLMALQNYPVCKDIQGFLYRVDKPQKAPSMIVVADRLIWATASVDTDMLNCVFVKLKHKPVSVSGASKIAYHPKLRESRPPDRVVWGGLSIDMLLDPAQLKSWIDDGLGELLAKDKFSQRVEIIDTIHIQIPIMQEFLTQDLEQMFIRESALRIMLQIEASLNGLNIQLPDLDKFQFIPSNTIVLVANPPAAGGGFTATTVPNNLHRQALQPVEPFFQRRYIKASAGLITGMNLVYDRATRQVQVTGMSVNGAPVPNFQIQMIRMKKNVWVGIQNQNHAGQELIITVSTRSITTTRDPVTGVYDTSGVDLASQTNAQRMAEYPGYAPNTVGVFMSRVALIHVEEFGILRAVDGNNYALADLPEPENTREQYTMARALFISRNALQAGFGLNQLNSKALTKYAFCRILDTLERTGGKRGRLSRFDRDYTKALGTVDARSRVPVSRGIADLLRNDINAVIPFRVDIYPCEALDQADEAIESFLRLFELLDPQKDDIRLVGSPTAGMALGCGLLLMLLRKGMPAINDLQERMNGDSPQLRGLALVMHHMLAHVIEELSALRPPAPPNPPGPPAPLNAAIAAIRDKLAGDNGVSMLAAFGGVIPDAQTIAEMMNIIGSPLALTESTCILNHSSMNMLKADEPGWQIVFPNRLGLMQVFRYRNSGLVTDPSLGDDATTLDLELVFHVGGDPVGGFMISEDPGMFQDVQCMIYRNIKPPVPEIPYKDFDVSALLPPVAGKSGKFYVVGWDYQIRGLPAYISSLVASGVPVSAVGFDTRFPGVSNYPYTTLDKKLDGSLDDELLYAKFAINRLQAPGHFVIINSLRRLLDGSKPRHGVLTGEDAKQMHSYIKYRFKNSHIVSEQTVWNQFRAMGKYASYDRVREALLADPSPNTDITQNTYIYLE